MRRVCLWVVLGLALLLGLLSACEPEAAENNSRPEQGELALPLEGDAQERLDVVLWQEEGFSLYVPAQGWYQEKDGTWRPEEQEDVGLFVHQCRECGSQALWKELGERFPNYGFLPPEDGVCMGYDAVGGMTMRVRLVEGESGAWAVCACYPDDLEESGQNQLALLADTFQAR